jgi:hypothetical protein
MFKGEVHFRAAVTRGGLTAFDRLEYDPNEPGVERVEVEGVQESRRLEVRCTVHLASVPSPAAGRETAETVAAAAFNRIAFRYGAKVEYEQSTHQHFIDLSPPPTTPATGARVEVLPATVRIGAPPVQASVGINREQLKAELEQVSPPGERYYGLFRSAMQFIDPVDGYLRFYNLLLMLHNDSQAEVDRFIVREEPGVPRTPRKDKPHFVETAYTRLRNERGHHRGNANFDVTRAEMGNRLRSLMALVRKAIETAP